MRHEFWQFPHQSKDPLPQSEAAFDPVISLDECHIDTPVSKPPVRRTRLESGSVPGQVQTSTGLFLVSLICFLVQYHIMAAPVSCS